MHKLLLSIITLTIFAAAQEQTKVDNLTPLRSYNHKSSLKLSQEQRMKRLAHIDSQKAKELANLYCKGKITSQELSHRGQLLFYSYHTNSCSDYTQERELI